MLYQLSYVGKAGGGDCYHRNGMVNPHRQLELVLAIDIAQSSWISLGHRATPRITGHDNVEPILADD